jgi:hypothetical protein
MAEWLYEAGIGERRAALVAGGQIVRAEVERDGDGPRVGTVTSARLGARDVARRRAAVRLADGGEAWLSPLPAGLSEGTALMVRVTRMALREAGRIKPTLVQLAEGDAANGPDLLARIAATGLPVRRADPAAPEDVLERAGWSELLAAARAGDWAFPDGALAIALTPAMTLIDVDGDLAPPALAEAGAVAAAAAIRALGLTGSIGIDFPTLAGRAERQSVDALLAAALADWPHERTAMNGFGFVQIVARRERPSLIERVQLEPELSDALALLRLGERAVGAGPLTLTARDSVITLLAAQPGWLEALARRTGRPVVLSHAPIAGVGHAQ